MAGLDPRRFHIVAAVTDQSLGLKLGRCELFGASAGGLRLDDPGTDLAVAAALASAACGRPPPPATAFVAEISLAGCLRGVVGMELRMSAARAAGVEAVVVPAEAGIATESFKGLNVIRAGHVRQALSFVANGPVGTPASGRRAAQSSAQPAAYRP